MAGLTSNLIEVLKGQIVLYEQIIALSTEKKEYIIANDIENLRRVVGEENNIVPKILRQDRQREKIMADICLVLNKKLDEFTLTTLVGLIEGQPEHDALKDIVDKTRISIEKMGALNESNNILIENALDFVNYNINVIHSTFSPQPAGYGDNDDNMEQSSFLDING